MQSTSQFTSVSAGAGIPILGKFNLTISGVFVGSVGLERSFDKGVTYHPITNSDGTELRFTKPCSVTAEEIEEGVAYRPVCYAYTSGTIAVRLSA